MSKKIPDHDRSPHGWWIASILTRLEEEGEDTSDPGRRCVAWEDTIILKARDRNQAYRKAMTQARAKESDGYDMIDVKTRCRAKWVLEGLTSLLPIYDKLEDGAEVLWEEHYRAAKTLASWVKAKGELEVFLDDD